MQHTHRLAYLAGHLLIDLPEGRFVVDTGSPASFGDSGTATYGGRPQPLPRSAGGIGLPELAGLGLQARIGARLLTVMKAAVVRRLVLGLLLCSGLRALLKGLGIWN